MDVLFWGTWICGLGFILFLRAWFSSHGGRRPPGPYGLPVVGYMPFLSSQLHLDFSRLVKRYGKIFGLQMGSRYVVVISDFQIMKEAFIKDAFQGRPPEFPVDFSKKLYETGAFFDLPFKDQRRFALHMLKDLGIGKSKMEILLQEEIAELLKHLQNVAEKPFCVAKLLASSMSNNIGALMFGKRFKYDDPVRQMLNDGVTSAMSLSQQVGWLVFFPILKKSLKFFGLFSIDKYEENINRLRKYIKKEVDEHKKTLNPDNIRDFIDGYLVEMNKRKDNLAFCTDVLEDLVFIFFIAGSESVTASVEWLFLLAAAMPIAQHRIQSEIDETVRQDRMPDWMDHNSMPYTVAFIMEFNRWRNVLPISVVRRTLTDTEAGGYFIPKDSLVISHLWEIHKASEYWGSDVDEFRPERFLTDDGKSIRKWDQYIPFSIGKRSCPGETLAKVEVFLYFTAVLQKFNLRMPDGKKADLQGTLMNTLRTKPQDIVMTKRE